MKYYSPGRVNLIGEHIDYNGGNVFPAAISLGTYAEVNARKDSIITLYSKSFVNDGTIQINLEEELLKDNNWADYVKGVILELRKRGFNVDKGFNAVIEGTIPNGSGLSSSASLEVLFIRIIIDLNNLVISDKEVALIAQAAENNFVGVKCGIMDQFVIANGAKDMVLNLNCATLEYEEVPCELGNYKLGNYKLVIMNTRKRRELAESAYNDRRNTCDNALEIIKKYYDISELCELKVHQLEEVSSKLDPIMYKRVLHAVTEQERVIASVDLLKKGDIVAFANLINASHQSLRDLYEVSCFELDTFVEILMANGAIGARMTGAGFGGCAIAIVPANEVDNIVYKSLDEYKEITGLEGEIYLVDISGKAGRYE